MKIQVPSLAIALAIAVPIAVAGTAKSSAAPINGTSIKAAVPAMTTDVRYRVRRDRGARGVQRTPNDYPYPSYRGYPTYNSYWGYPAYNSYWRYPTYYYPSFSYGWGDYYGW
ncbi:hypothetical protein [Bradyrhizobium cenepequi]|uniref:hypothetical protein n=1 Tax=Bradyrhizobium cenepequi TaxID=2821403 RepID=UPI001CE36389|nr:hypothetical protein [Bradyrhizobium cenepequi]MCA6108291.1 hypothetical protein [Bradyrhizobium cenepequi]